MVKGLTSIPDLSLDRLPVDVYRPRSEFDTDRRLGLEVELVPGETGEDCRGREGGGRRGWREC